MNEFVLADKNSLSKIADALREASGSNETYTVPELSAAAVQTISSGGGGIAIQADWNQKDENSKDFIKNKPFYLNEELIYILPEISIESEIPTELAYSLEWGKEYIVNINGIDYPVSLQYIPLGILAEEEVPLPGLYIENIMFIMTPPPGKKNLLIQTGEGLVSIPFNIIPINENFMVETFSIKHLKKEYKQITDDFIKTIDWSKISNIPFGEEVKENVELLNLELNNSETQIESLELNENSVYKIILGEEIFDCFCYDMILEGASLKVLGDIGLMLDNSPMTGEPFVFASIPSMGVSMLQIFDSAISYPINFTIVGPQKETKLLDPKYLGALEPELIISYNNETEEWECSDVDLMLNSSAEKLQRITKIKTGNSSFFPYEHSVNHVTRSFMKVDGIEENQLQMIDFIYYKADLVDSHQYDSLNGLTYLHGTFSERTIFSNSQINQNSSNNNVLIKQGSSAGSIVSASTSQLIPYLKFYLNENNDYTYSSNYSLSDFFSLDSSSAYYLSGDTKYYITSISGNNPWNLTFSNNLKLQIDSEGNITEIT